MLHDILIIGKGLIGSAIAKHLSLSQKNIAIIGPDEPEDVSNAVVYASHYDSGRVQRLIGQTDAMTELNIASVKHYPWLEKVSGIHFHKKSGCLYVNPLGSDEYLEKVSERAEKFGIEAIIYNSNKELAKAFPEFHFPEKSQGMFEPSPSGHISPPLLIKAQLKVFEQNGGTIFRDTVNGLAFKNDFVEISTYEGNVYHAAKVVLAAGAFSNFSNLLSRELDLVIKSETVLLARVSKEEATRLVTLPSLLYEIDNGQVEGIYSTQPIQYPDGHFYLKMGCNLPHDIFFGNDLSEIQQWFRNGDSKASELKMLKVLQSIIPDLKIEGCTTKRCILPRTQRHKNPYIGKIHDGLYITAGNGWSAMCSDGVGFVMSHLVINNKFPEGYEATDFEPFFK
ncbi:MAG: FAD-dependent oxidoreductase [Chitinophagales bacterium]